MNIYTQAAERLSDLKPLDFATNRAQKLAFEVIYDLDTVKKKVETKTERDTINTIQNELRGAVLFDHHNPDTLFARMCIDRAIDLLEELGAEKRVQK